MNKNNLDSMVKYMVCFAILGVAMVNTALAQQGAGGLEQAAQTFQNTAQGVMRAVKIGLLVLGGGAAAIGAVGALSKSTVEGEQASKSFVKWFVAAGLFGMAWLVIDQIFGA